MGSNLKIYYRDRQNMETKHLSLNKSLQLVHLGGKSNLVICFHAIFYLTFFFYMSTQGKNKR